MNVLADTSVWIEYWRDGRGELAEELDRLLRQRAILVCGPVVAELVVGTSPEDREQAWLILGTLPWAELDRGGWWKAGEVGYTLRRGGVRVPLTDILIAVACVHADATLWTKDRDFERIRAVLPDLSLYRRP